LSEPAKFEKNPKWGNWRISQAWKDWQMTKKKEKKIVDEENHTYRWKEVALQVDTGKGVLFCACMSGTAEPFKTCGATAVRYTRAGKIHELIGPRWE